MKRTLLISVAALLAGITLAPAPVFQSIPFNNGYTVFLTNNTTTAYAANYVQYIAPNGNLNVANTSTSTVPVIYVNGVLSPFFPTVITNANSVIYYTNTPTVNTNTTLGAAWLDVPLFADANGNAANATLSVAARLPTAGATNLLTLLFSRIPMPGYPITREQNADRITVAFGLAGITNQCVVTNLASWFTYGTWGVRLQSITVANSSTNDIVILDKVSLNGYVP